MWRCWCKKWLCGYNGRYVATHTIDRNAVHTNWKSVKNGSSDYVIGWVECYLMAIEVLCIVDGIGRGVVCWVKKNDFSPRRESLRLDGLYVELRSVLWIIPTALQWAFVALLKRKKGADGQQLAADESSAVKTSTLLFWSEGEESHQNGLWWSEVEGNHQRRRKW